MGFVFILEVTERGKHRIRRGPPQRTERAVPDSLRQSVKLVQVLQASLTLGKLFQHGMHPLDPQPAGNTLAAGFIHEKFQEIFGHIHHAVPFIHDDHTPRPHHRSHLGQGIKIYGGIFETPGDTTSGGAAGLDDLELASARHPPADVFDNALQADTHGHFHRPFSTVWTYLARGSCARLPPPTAICV
jgi:hypothetical protein